MKRWIKRLENSVGILEIVVGVIVGVGVLVGIPDLFKYLSQIILSPKSTSYQEFSDFLRHALLLVVGLELLIMIITHSHESILTLVLFVIARKMLVYADGMLDIFIGTLSIAVIFLVMRFASKDEKMLATFDNIFSAALPVEKIRREYGYDLPSHISYTLGGLVYELAKEQNISLEEGREIILGSYRLAIIALSDGVIERIRISENL